MTTERARLNKTEHGLVPQGPGWYVVNARETPWLISDDLGIACTFEGDSHFQQLGINISVINPGEPSCMYHAEGNQEDFLVLSGSARLIIEEEEKLLKQWDFVHCPPGTRHVLVGTGDHPAVVLMVGARQSRKIEYPVSDVASKYNASVKEATNEPSEAYASFNHPRTGSYPEGALP